MYLRIYDNKLLEIYKTIWTKIEDLKNCMLYQFFIHLYIKSKIRGYGGKFYTNFRNLNLPELGEECGSFTAISIDSLLVYEKKSITCKYI